MMASFLDALVLTVVGLAVVFLVLAIDALVTSLLKSASQEKKEAATPLPSQRTLFEQEPMKGLPEAEGDGETFEEVNQKCGGYCSRFALSHVKNVKGELRRRAPHGC